MYREGKNRDFKRSLTGYKLRYAGERELISEGKLEDADIELTDAEKLLKKCKNVATGD